VPINFYGKFHVWNTMMGGIIMTVAISSAGPSLDATVDPRFGRCEFFLIIELDSMSFEAVPNTSTTLEGGAGVQAAKLLIDRGVETVLTGYIGPNAERVLSSAGLNVITAVSGTVSEIADQYKQGRIMPTRKSDIDEQKDDPFPKMEKASQSSLPRVGIGRGMGGARTGGKRHGSLGRTHSFVMGRYCVCPNCGEWVPHELDKARFQEKCPKCGAAMTMEQVI
jgi:predicted Fe-Mo cluster-binding NifX family protein